jgi:hypothetical protein
MSTIAAEKVEMIVNAPVVSTESTSPEAILARSAKRLQVQAEADSKFDTVLEGFGCQSDRINPSLLGSVFAIGLLFAGAAYFRR